MTEVLGRVKGELEVATGCIKCRGVVDFELYRPTDRRGPGASSRVAAMLRQARGSRGGQLAAAAVSRGPLSGGWPRGGETPADPALGELEEEIRAVRQERDGHLRAARLRLAGECCALLEQLQREYVARRLAAAV